ncbi:hypothetical protein [Pseudarthrobacter sp. MDT1-22]
MIRARLFRLEGSASLYDGVGAETVENVDVADGRIREGIIETLSVAEYRAV